MALAPRPEWEPLPEPPGPDPARAQEFPLLAAEDMPTLEAEADLQGLDLGAVDQARVESELATDVLALDLAAGAQELAGMQLEAAADTLVPELQAAAEQDAAILAAANEAATVAGEPVSASAPLEGAEVPAPFTRITT